MSTEGRVILDRDQEEVTPDIQSRDQANTITSGVDHSQVLAEQQGDIINNKLDKVFRIGVININGLTHTARNPKNRHIKNVLDTYQFDHFGMAETNCNWSKMDDEDRWYNRAKSMWKKSKSVVANNTRDISNDTKQPGGVLSITIGNAVSSITASGKDSILGRWAWVTYKGKHDIHTTIITGYRPCKNLKDDNSTYNQHIRYLSVQNIQECPRKLWLTDMKRLVQQKIEEGHQVILLADINEDVKSNNIKNWAAETGIEEIVSTTTELTVPTSQQGSKPIDGIFVSPSLIHQQAGYFPFGTIQSDHRALWVDIGHDHMFGFKLPSQQPSNARRLQCQIPHVRESWKRHYKNFLIQNKLISRQIQLEKEIATKGMTLSMQNKYEKILQQRQEGMLYADRKCRKLRCGQVPYSPELVKASTTIQVWKAASTIKAGGIYSSRLFRRQEKQVGLKHSLSLSKEQIKDKEKEAWKQYWAIKKRFY